MTADVKSVLNEDEFYPDIVDTQKESAEQYRN